LSLEPFEEQRSRFGQAVGNRVLNMNIGESIGLSNLFGE